MIRTFVLLSLSLVLFSCQSSKQQTVVQRAANRTIGFDIREIKIGENGNASSEIESYFSELLKQSLIDTYQSRVLSLELEEGPLETPENYFRIASNQIDDLFVFRIELPANFKIPESMDSESVEARERETGPMDFGQAKFSANVYNGERLRPIARLQWSNTLQDRTRFEEALSKTASTSYLNDIRNPNIYPPSDPLHFADRLYEFAVETERQAEGGLSCDNAEDLLNTFAKASKLYGMAETRIDFGAVGSQSSLHELQGRMNEAKKKADTLEMCREDANKSFSFSVSFDGFDSSAEQQIRAAIKSAQIEEVLKFYTNKPAEMSVRLDSEGDINISLDMRFNKERLQELTKEDLPAVFKGYHPLSLQAYHPLMQRLILMRVALPAGTARSLGVAFNKAVMNLNLNTLLGGSVSFRVDGRYVSDQKRVDLFYPNSIRMDIPGYEAITLITRSDEIFQEKAWIALGSCRTVDGSLTDDGLAVQFFGMTCQL